MIHYAQNVQQRQPVKVPTEKDVDQAFADAAKVFKNHILTVMSPKVTGQDVSGLFGYQGQAAIDKFESTHPACFKLLSRALRLMLDEATRNK